ncbi:MAG: ABC transporter substrate-binding protein [Proteobacteria bacterium]|nr:ABC transporter substrate-binding protein [Pseudomonadota bacterium]
MKVLKSTIATALALGFAAALWAGGAAAGETPVRGGILKFVVGSKIPSYDAHMESTFGMIHPIRPFYSLLIRVNPENPSSPTDFVCDLCEGDVPAATNNGLTYTFKIRKDVWFHDGTPLTAYDIKATFDKIVFPPEGVPSTRKAFFSSLDSITVPDKYTVVFNMKYASGAFLPAVAAPYNFVYSKKDLDEKGYAWHQKNINGTGAFTFVEHKPGAYVDGKRYEKYHFKGKPYLDGFRAISAPKMAVRLQAIRGNQAAIEFRGFPPKARDDLVAALGDKIVVQESDWNCALQFLPNHRRKPFDDVRVRRALTLAVDRRAGSKYLSQIAIVKTMGGIVFPGHPLAATEEELSKIAGYWPSIDKSRAEARRLLKEAGVEGLEFVLLNRGVDQPYRVVGTWLIDQWKKVGMKVTQNVLPTPAFYDAVRKKHDFDVTIYFNCQSIVNPLADVSGYLSDDIAGNNYSGYQDRTMDKLFDQMNRSNDPAEQRRIMRAYEKRALDEEALQMVTLWWYKINPHRSYVKGWKIAPSHYLNQHLDNIWLDPHLM